MIARAINGNAAFITSLAIGLLLVLLHRCLTRLCYAMPALEHLGAFRVGPRDRPRAQRAPDRSALPA